jgi:hypothetical protein
MRHPITQRHRRARPPWRRIWHALTARRSAHEELERAVEFCLAWGARVRRVTESDGITRTCISLQAADSRWLSVSDRDLIACVRVARDHVVRDALRGLA